MARENAVYREEAVEKPRRRREKVIHRTGIIVLFA